MRKPRIVPLKFEPIKGADRFLFLLRVGKATIRKWSTSAKTAFISYSYLVTKENS